MVYDNVPQESGWRAQRVGQGVLLEDGRVLLSANRWYSDRPPVWTLPGGRAEESEGVAEAVVREFKEETGLTVEVTGLAFVAEARSTRRHQIFLTCGFTVRRMSGELTCEGDPAVEEVRFVRADELGIYLPNPSLGEPLSWFLKHPSASARYWYYPEYA
jgi:ADP-ribose pyrophosphatase YjhB (NUDIX family)